MVAIFRAKGRDKRSLMTAAISRPPATAKAPSCNTMRSHRQLQIVRVHSPASKSLPACPRPAELVGKRYPAQSSPYRSVRSGKGAMALWALWHNMYMYMFGRIFTTCEPRRSPTPGDIDLFRRGHFIEVARWNTIPKHLHSGTAQSLILWLVKADDMIAENTSINLSFLFQTRTFSPSGNQYNGFCCTAAIQP